MSDLEGDLQGAWDFPGFSIASSTTREALSCRQTRIVDLSTALVTCSHLLTGLVVPRFTGF